MLKKEEARRGNGEQQDDGKENRKYPTSEDTINSLLCQLNEIEASWAVAPIGSDVRADYAIAFFSMPVVEIYRAGWRQQRQADND